MCFQYFKIMLISFIRMCSGGPNAIAAEIHCFKAFN